MEYFLKYIFTDGEYAKLVSIVNPNKPVHETPAHVAEIRQFVRLFLKTWIASATFKRLTSLKSARGNSAKLASILVAFSVTYRYTYKYLKRPAISGALAGLVLARGLPNDVASYLGIYVATKLCEWIYNYADDHKLLEWKPRLMGSWVLFPIAFSQLFHTLIVHPHSTPLGFKRLMILLSNGTLTPVVPGEAMEFTPTPEQVLSSISGATSNGFPSFKSPIVYGEKASGLVNAGDLQGLLLTAHPGNTTLLSALIHPAVDNDAHFFFDSLQSNIALLAKILVPLYLARAYFGKTSTKDALSTAVRTSLVYAIVSSTAFTGIQLSRYWLGKDIPRTIRLRFIGLLSGLWAILIQRSGHAQFLYATRLAILSSMSSQLLSKLPFVALPITTALAFTIINKHPEAVSQQFYLKLAHWIQYGEWNI